MQTGIKLVSPVVEYSLLEHHDVDNTSIDQTGDLYPEVHIEKDFNIVNPLFSKAVQLDMEAFNKLSYEEKSEFYSGMKYHYEFP